MKKTNALMFSESPDIPVVEINGKRRYVYCHDETKFIQMLSIYKLAELYKHIFTIISVYPKKYKYDIVNIKTNINGYPALFTYIVETRTLLCNDHLINIELESIPDFKDIREENIYKIYNQTLFLDMFFLILRSIGMPKELFNILCSQINVLRILDNDSASSSTSSNFNMGIGEYGIESIDVNWINEKVINLYINYRIDHWCSKQTTHITLSKRNISSVTLLESKDKYKLNFIDIISIADAIFDLIIKNLIISKNTYIKNSIERYNKELNECY